MVWTLLRPLFRAALVNNKTFCPPRKALNFSNNFVFRGRYCTQIQSTDEAEDPLDKIVQDIAKGDIEMENQMRLCLLEIDLLQQSGKKAPSPLFVKKQHWEHLMTLSSRSSRQRYFTYLFEIQMKDENKKAKQLERAKELEEVRMQNKLSREEKLKSGEILIEYGIQDLSMFLRIYETSMNKVDNFRLHQASMFGQKLIIDCSYDKHMTYREQSNAGNQLTLLFADNRSNRDPFDMHFCNVDPDTETIRKLHRNIPTINDPGFPINLHKESYLDLFPREKLVYLTPHCRTELTEFDKDAYYIIGCMVDKAHSEPLSLAKAKEYNLKVAKLPLDRYLQWSGGSGKSLTLNQVLKILLDIKATGDWVQALRHVPRRKLYHEDSLQKSLGRPSNQNYASRRKMNNNLFNNRQSDNNDTSYDENRQYTSSDRNSQFSKDRSFDGDRQFNNNRSFDRNRRYTSSDRSNNFSKDRSFNGDSQFNNNRSFDRNRQYTSSDRSNQFSKDRSFDGDRQFANNRSFNRDKQFTNNSNNYTRNDSTPTNFNKRKSLNIKSLLDDDSV